MIKKTKLISAIRKIFYLIRNLSKKLLNQFYKLSFIEKPLPKKNFISNLGSIKKSQYLLLHKKAIKKENQKVINFEKKIRK